MTVKESTTPLERSTQKMDVLMRSFGMRTRIFKGSTRAVVKGTRKVYPYELNATLVETARGVGIRIKLEKIWYSFLKLIPFFIIILFSLLQFLVPNAGEVIANATGINLFLVLLGPNPRIIGLWIVLPIISAIIIGSEILERIIRARYIQDRMPRFLSGAEWNIAEPPIVLDFISATNNLLWIMFVFLIIIFAPMSFSAEIFENFLTVYEVESSALINTTALISVLDISILSGMMFAILYQNYEKFRGSLDRQQIRHDIRLESQTRQLVQVGIGSTLLSTILLACFYFTFWSNITIIQVIIFYSISIVSSVIGVWLFWHKENYIFIAMAIWFLLSDVVMIFLNANDASYSWMIICHLFLILLVVILSINRYFENYLAKKGVYEPSWMFNLLPLFAYVAVFWKKKIRVTRGVEKELEEILEEDLKEKVKEKQPLVIDIDKIRKKGKESIKIVQFYQRTLSRIVSGEINILLLANINSQILDIIKEEKQLHKEAKKLFSTVDSLLWEDNYTLKDGKNFLQIAEKVYEEIVKKR
ncbi:MAG: hypothetical protein KAS63_08655 [Candidatus Heimdallarchaeota archaeon]|nr:hypothetical protein [Candidatus Heimdallarchaeota archaeon]MCK4955417.1 hypothetical protein [Candidatus Heimdallarchaeota archaeon]